MHEALIAATDVLNGVLAEENALLDALDLKAAVALLGRKRDAVAALQNTLAGWKPAAEPNAEKPNAEEMNAGEPAAGEPTVGEPTVGEPNPQGAEKLQDSMRRLAALSHENRVAIERGLALQTRLIQTIARAVPRARAQEAPVYQPNGTQLPPRPPEAYAFRSRM
jgi:hypothetical protein